MPWSGGKNLMKFWGKQLLYVWGVFLLWGKVWEKGSILIEGLCWENGSLLINEFLFVPQTSNCKLLILFWLNHLAWLNRDFWFLNGWDLTVKAKLKNLTLVLIAFWGDQALCFALRKTVKETLCFELCFDEVLIF